VNIFTSKDRWWKSVRLLMKKLSVHSPADVVAAVAVIQEVVVRMGMGKAAARVAVVKIRSSFPEYPDGIFLSINLVECW
jgi:hypothetical protein